MSVQNAAPETVTTQDQVDLNKLSKQLKLTANWKDLALPDPDIQQLRELAKQIRQRQAIKSKGLRRGGVIALFSGPSGTGKTMAAQVLAKEGGLDLYRVDLSKVVSKYIGETEKNLERMLDSAEHKDVILLFDEADALFGKRTEVKDSHDRYASLDTNYLLQRLENYQGIIILTSNLKGSIDKAFLRRLNYVIEFPLPTAGKSVNF